MEEERLREIEAQAEQERITLEEERVEAAKAEAEAERLQKDLAAVSLYKGKGKSTSEWLTIFWEAMQSNVAL